MTELRQHIDSLRAEHGSARYPGDLAADVLGGRGAIFRRRWLWASACASALAAAAAVGIVLMRHPAATNLPPATIGPAPGSIASIRPIPLGPVPVGVPIDRAPPGGLSLEFPSRPTAPAGLTLAPSLAAPPPSYTELRMPAMPTSPWSPAGRARHAPAGRQQPQKAAPPTSHPTLNPSQEAA